MTEVLKIDPVRENTVEKYFSRRSEYWDSLYSDPEGPEAFTKYELKRRKELVFDLIGNRPDGDIKTALDLGCGAGQYMAHLAQMGFDCCGADISEEMLQIAREKIPVSPSVKWIRSDCRSVPMEDHFFDLVLCAGVLEYLPDDLQAMQEIRRLVTPGGSVILTFPNLYKLRNLLNPYYYLVRLWTYLFVRKSSQTLPGAAAQFDFCKSTVRRYSLRKVYRLAAAAGLRVAEVRGCCFGPFSLWKKQMVPLRRTIRISAALEALSRRRGFRFLRFFANRWVLLLQPDCSGREHH